MEVYNEQDYSEKKVDLKLWKRLFAYALRNKKILAQMIVSMALVSAIDACYPLLTAYAIDHFIIPMDGSGLWTFAAVYMVVVVVQSFFTFGFISRAGKMEMKMSYDIRQDAFLRLQTLSFSYYDKTAVGYIMARMVSDIARLSEMIAWSIVDVLWSLCYIGLCVGIMFAKNWALALIVLAVIPPLCVVSIILQKKILRYQRDARRHNSRITGAFNEGIMGAMTTKTLVREEENAKEFDGLTSSMRKASIKATVTSALFFPLIISLGAVGTALALVIGGKGVISPELSIVGGITAGTLVAFISYAANLFDPIQQLAHILADLQGAQASAERVLTLVDTVPEVTDSPEVEAVYGTTMDPKRENWEPLHGDVEFDHVSFAYGNGERVLNDFSLKIKQGQTIALVGETGAGKSTIVNLICRFYEPTEGRILIDGRDYRERSQLWLQSRLGYVLQQPHLFSGTIRENLCFGRDDATDEQVMQAVRMVGAEDFITAMDKGLNTEVGEGGVRLSTGQKQLISFARVILADPRIFVLDEATSSVDTETEQRIQNAITKVLTGRTSLVVAHRLSTIRNADLILVIRDGRIVESGTHDELLTQNGYFHDLYVHQFREERTRQTLA